MSDRFHPLSPDRLCTWIATELRAKDSIFGIPRELFFIPRRNDPFRTAVFQHPMETPIGVAAGPHSQLAQNIIAAWLCGARFIELKTVQTVDNLEISKPCIDMQDEGYNVEWSQELKVEQSFHEYLHAWVLIHALHRRLGFPGNAPDVIFNLSVGYDLAGIRQPNMQWYLDHAQDAGEHIERCLKTVARHFPEIRDTTVPTQMSDNVTLSTMHGCPPDEIGDISEYLLATRGLHTCVKLNPTLLGVDRVRNILNQSLGYHDLEFSDQVFSDDLAYPDALDLISKLQGTAEKTGLDFGVKLTNTLPVTNHRRIFDSSEQTMYLSGRPLHALTVELARRLADDVEKDLFVSFSGGADSHNIPHLLRAGMRTVTVCSDLLRPGGYLRIQGYLEAIRNAMDAAGTSNVSEFITTGVHGLSATEAARANLRDYSGKLLSDPALHKKTYDREHTKTNRSLGFFDCIKAPCTDACSVDQKVPEYMRRVRDGDLPGAAAITREDNPLASILGRACHHPCESVCLRTHIDQPLAIREIKRFITDSEFAPDSQQETPVSDGRTAIIGGGPCGLSAATFLARAGHQVTIFEARSEMGGMVSATIPDYRASKLAIARDLDRLRSLGVEIRYGQEVGTAITLDGLRAEGFSALVVAAGAREGLRLGLDEEESRGVIDGLNFLRAARSGRAPALGRRIGVIGGGDVAMDCARTAVRLDDTDVTIYYRRTRAEMPAHGEEITDLIEEGGAISELVAPLQIVAEDSQLVAVRMQKTRLGEPDSSGRRRPEPIEDATEDVELDTLIVAIGQRADLGLFGDTEIALTPSGYLQVDPDTLETSIPGVYAGGDIIGSGPANIVKAAGDGRCIADAIIAREQVIDEDPIPHGWPDFDHVDLLRRRSIQVPREPIPHLPPDQRTGFAEVVQTLSPESARREAARCLDCDVLCSTCDSVCPNRAILTYRTQPAQISVPRVETVEGAVVVRSTEVFRIEQGPQVAVLTDACNECGNCVTFCPTADRPWRDKPRLYLNRGEFEAQTDNAFMFLTVEGSRGLQARSGDRLHQLVERDGHLQYRGPGIELRLHRNTLIVKNFRTREEVSDQEMQIHDVLGALIVLHRSFAESMPEFPLIEADQNWLVQD